MIVALAPSTVNPAPLAAAAEAAPLATVTFKSATSRVCELTVVVVPWTVKFPVTVMLPPTFKLAPIPTPPVTTTAPVVVLSDCVAAVNVVAPVAVNVVKAPVALVFAPIGKLSA